MPDEPTRPEHVTAPWPGQSASDQGPDGPAPVVHAPVAPPGYRPGGWPGDEDEDDWPDDDEPGAPWPPLPAGTPDQPRRRRPVILAAIGLVALLAGAGVTLAVTSELSPSAPAAAGRTQSPVVTRPGGAGQQPGGALPGGAGTTQMFIAGRVQAISPKSITIGGPGRSVTAAITSSTRVSGRVTSASQIKVGDNASAQITMRNGKSVVTAIQDPAQQPSGGGLP